MKAIKSERLRKLEAEFNDLQQWLQLGLVPKKDIEKHKEEIQALQEKIEEEKERLQFLKEGGEAEEFIIPKRNQAKAGYNEMPTIPDIDRGESIDASGGFEMETYISEESTSDDDEGFATGEFEEGEEKSQELEEDESYFSDKNRWKRGGIVDPDADEW